jgi:radical SAM enzyme (TIGR01210 family)
MSDPQEVRIDDRWIRSRRENKNPVDPFRPYHHLVEKERTLSGKVEEVITLFLTNRECRFTCLMCDLWKNTTDRPVPPGAVPAQVDWALRKLPPTRHIKLYNSSSFFDPGAIPPSDYPAIAALVEPFDTLVVENHPNLTGEICLSFASMIRPRLQVAMGLETSCEETLRRLNKRMKPADFRRAVSFLKEHGISTRAFILLRPPFTSESEGIRQAKESIRYAFESGTDCCTVIPTRPGNGAVEYLQSRGMYTPPRLESLEEVMEFGIGLEAGPVFADTWDLTLFSTCDRCFGERTGRLSQMNLAQEIPPGIRCNCIDSL